MRQVTPHIIRKKVQAFTLFESVVAISIITVLIGLGTMIYGNLMNAEKPLSYYQAKNEIDRRFHLLCQSKAFFSQAFEYETYQIEQKVELYQQNKKLYQVTYVASVGNKIVLTEHHLVASEGNE